MSNDIARKVTENCSKEESKKAAADKAAADCAFEVVKMKARDLVFIKKGKSSKFKL